ncbi:helix-turn-helix domain-containing protein [Actinosynnema sp. NPDC050436]|uniref:ArsR/SmtB family transcription factor n=1 Tax=Actinosynnema sp. NPDC050436 TaxID=3155659 RepID=UPI0033C5EA1A
MAEPREDLIRDPRELRALAHPFRWKLIDLLASEGERTATQCARALGESVPSCSYHLNVLAKYGFVEEVPDVKGRQKPWRMLRHHQSWSSEGVDDEMALAAEAAGDALVEQEFATMRERLRGKGLEPPEWRRATGIRAHLEFLTAEELDEVHAAMFAVLDKYADRRQDPAARPEGARPVRIFQATTVAPRRD